MQHAHVKGYSVKPLTTTSYAILGLLAIKPWTTYELAKQMEVSLRNFWPRAERKLYEEPRKLVAYKLATVQHETVGKRPRCGRSGRPGPVGQLNPHPPHRARLAKAVSAQPRRAYRRCGSADGKNSSK